jgi:uncharacterized protein (DUF1330 family)
MGPFGGFRSAADFGGRTPANCIRQRATCGLSRCCDVTRWVAVRPDRSRALRHSCDQEMKAYFVLDITVQDYKRFKTYIDEIPKIIERRRGKSIVQGAEPVVLEEERGHQRLVVIEFRSPLFLNPDAPSYRCLVYVCKGSKRRSARHEPWVSLSPEGRHKGAVSEGPQRVRSGHRRRQNCPPSRRTAFGFDRP